MQKIPLAAQLLSPLLLSQQRLAIRGFKPGPGLYIRWGLPCFMGGHRIVLEFEILFG